MASLDMVTYGQLSLISYLNESNALVSYLLISVYVNVISSSYFAIQ